MLNCLAIDMIQKVFLDILIHEIAFHLHLEVAILENKRNIIKVECLALYNIMNALQNNRKYQTNLITIGLIIEKAVFFG